MKSNHVKLILASLAAAIAIPLAAADSDSSSSRNRTTKSGKSDQTQSFDNRKASKLLNADVKSSDNQSLGDVEELILDPATGKIQFVVLGQGGVMGMGGDLVPVPWDAVKVQSNGEIIINQSRQRLSSAPSLRSDYANLNEPTFNSTIHQFYGTSESGMGGSDSPGGSQQGQGGSLSSTNQITSPSGNDEE